MIIQLESSKISIKNLFKESLVELKGFEYKITLYVLLSKVKGSDFIEYSPVYFNSLTKTVISNKYFLDQCFNDIIFKLENWIWHGSGWIVEKIVSQYLNISSYLPLSGSSYCELPKKLSNSMKGLINIQITDQKCFLWCHIGHLNVEEVRLSRITNKDREIAKNLNYNRAKFSVSKKRYCKISVINKINISVFSYKGKVAFLIYLSDLSFDDTLDLILVCNHDLYIKDFNRLMFNKTKHKIKNGFVKVVYNILVMKLF